MIIGFAGLTHLGLVYLAATASKKVKVIGYDSENKYIQNLNSGILSIQEPQLNTYIKRYNKNILFTNSLLSLRKCDIVFISVDIPTNSKGESSYAKINKLIRKVTKTINKKTVLVVLSQVIPGYTRKINWPSHLLFYQVETLIFGKAIIRATSPERIIIGGNFSNSIKKQLPTIYNSYLNKFKCKILKMSYESAELTKISINLILISNISISNSLAEICVKINADWNEIMPALKLDKRIGKYSYLNPGLGLSGGNLERDLKTIYNIASKKEMFLETFNSFINSSNYYRSWILRNFKKYAYKKNIKPNVSLLGVTYKAKTSSYKNSPSLDIIKKLKFSEIRIFDPIVKDLKNIKKNVYFAENIYDSIKNSDVLIIMTPWDIFKKINRNKIKNLMRGNIIFDPFNVLGKNLPKINNLKYFTLGKK